MGCTSSKQLSSLIPSSSEQDAFLSEEDLEIDHLNQRIKMGSIITSMDISDDLSMLVTGTEKGMLEVWSTMSTPVESLAQFIGHQGSITCCRFHGNSVVSGSTDCCIIKWSILTMSMSHIYRGHSSKINEILCVGPIIFSSAYDRTAKAWRVTSHPREEDFMEAEAEGKILRLNTGNKSEDHEIDPSFSQESLSSSLCLTTFRGHLKSVYPLAFIPAEDNWDLDKRPLHERDLLITGSADCTARIWSVSTGETLKVLTGHTAPIHAIRVDHERTNAIFTAGGDGIIMAFDPITGECMRKLIGHEAAILSLDSYKSMLFSASADKTSRAWVMEFGEETRVFRGSKSPVTSIQFFAGFVYTGCEDGTARAFDSKSGTCSRLFKGHTDSVTHLQIIPGRLFTSSMDESICVWDTKGLKLETVFGEINEHEDQEDAEDDYEDGSEVIEAVKVLEKFLTKR